jgi:serine/threonine protein phosphatase PrpC
MLNNYINTYSLQGRRERNEDQHFTLLNLNNKNKKINKINLVCIFDGHGGKAVSKYLKYNLPPYFLKKNKRLDVFNEKKSIIAYYFTKLFDNVQNKLKTEHPIISSRCGSTALCGIHYVDNNNKQKLIMANVGDSRGVLCNGKNSAVPLTVDHKPNLPSEKKRIESLGGRIRFDGADWRIKDLSLSRAIGDLDTYPFVTHRPEIFRHSISRSDKFVIFACDGLWDVYSNQKAVNFVLKLLKTKYTGNISKKLAESAIKEGSYDNVTVSILFLN